MATTSAQQEVAPLKKRTTKQKKPQALRDKKTGRHNMRMYEEDSQYLIYWSTKFGMDQTEFLLTAMRHYVAWRNQDYDLPTAEVQRLNQMVDAVQNLAVRQEHLEKSVVNGIDALLGLMRGDTYLVEKEDGELS